jgi:hypothetical protein
MTGIDWTIVFGLCGLGAITTLLWHGHPNLAAALMVVGVTGLGISVSAVRMQDPQSGNAPYPVARTVPQASDSGLPLALATGTPVSYPDFGPMVRGATGAAAPPATTNPYAIPATRPAPARALHAAAP